MSAQRATAVRAEVFTERRGNTYSRLVNAARDSLIC